jgi:hypothetical protein
MPLTDVDLVVEDGTGLTNSNSYATRAAADAYHVPRDNTTWADADLNNKIASLIRATDYVDRRWRWKGTKKLETQALQWPRVGVVDANGFDMADEVPPAVRQAVMEYALRIVDDLGDLLPDPTEDERGAFITLKREKVGPIEEETRYSEAIPLTPIQAYPSADTILLRAGLVLGVGNSVIRG